MPMLSVENIKKRFGKNEVLKGVSFTIDEGEVVALIGPSGSGKSTILRCLNQLERVDSGAIRVGDDVLVQSVTSGAGETAQYAPKDVLNSINLRLGLVFQNFNLFPHMNVLENITTAPIHVKKMAPAEAEAKAHQLLAQVGLSDKADAYPFELSGGQQQRVAIARAMALTPDILFFDEPTSALDPELTGEVLKVIKQLASLHMTMMIVTHEMAFARDVADKVIFMDEGHIVAQGTPGEIFGQEQNERLTAFLRNFNNQEF